jgi:hypothetical protein
MTKYNDVINVTFGKFQPYKNLIHHPLKVRQDSLQPKKVGSFIDTNSPSRFG